MNERNCLFILGLANFRVTQVESSLTFILFYLEHKSLLIQLNCFLLNLNCFYINKIRYGSYLFGLYQPL